MTATPSSYLLNLPPVPPKPTPGCVFCERMVEKRASAWAQGDYSAVSDWNVKMRKHTHRTEPTPR